LTVVEQHIIACVQNEEGWGEKIELFSSLKRQYLENGCRYDESYY